MTHVPTLSELHMRHDPQGRGYHAVYRMEEVNHCPGCGRAQWIVGRFSAECAFCSTALPLAEAAILSASAPPEIVHKNAHREVRHAPAYAA